MKRWERNNKTNNANVDKQQARRQQKRERECRDNDDGKNADSTHRCRMFRIGPDKKREHRKIPL